jgi:hypothetical protein
MRLHPWMKAGLLLLAIAGTIIASTGTAQARRWRGGGYYGNGWGWGGRGWGWGGYGGYGWYGGYPSYGYAYSYPYSGYNYAYAPSYSNDGSYTTSYAPNMNYAYQGGQGCGTTTAAYPPSGPQPGTTGGYNGTTYEGGATPTYAPGTNAPPPPAGQTDNVNGQRGAAMNPGANNSGTANPPNPDTPPAPGNSAPPSPTTTPNQQNPTP